MGGQEIVENTEHASTLKKRLPLPVAQEGLIFIVPLILVTGLLYVSGIVPLFVFSLLLTLFVIYFFRDPHRTIPEDNKAIVSPADGKVIKIETVNQPLGEGEAQSVCVSIFLNVFNVHVNRVPCAGKIIKTEYNPGQFLPAFRDKASLLNEQTSVLIGNERVTILVKQIAGLIARRIVCWVNKGDYLKAGERFGLIRFGSRVDIFFPSNVEIRTKIGDKVKGGETIIGYIK